MTGDGTSPALPFPPPVQSRWRVLEAWLVVLIALHSVAVGVFLLAATEWGLAFGGWAGHTILFFPRQAGVFHLVVAAGYLLEWVRYRGVSFLVTAKSFAVVFLAVMTLMDGGPWVLPLSGLADGMMALAVVLAHRAAARAGSPGSRHSSRSLTVEQRARAG